MQSVSNKIVARIYGHGRGWVFSANDFTLDFKRDDVDKTLSNLRKRGTIRRICRGLYDFPEYSDLLKQELGSHYNQIAQALARKYGWTIYPCGEAALNLLGLSTQVPGRILYLSDGPGKIINAGSWTIEFKKTALKEMKLKPKTSLMVQAIKSMGRERFDDQLIHRFQKAFSISERKMIIKDAQGITGWVYELIRKICSDGSKTTCGRCVCGMY